jgi:hypothetical protein
LICSLRFRISTSTSWRLNQALKWDGPSPRRHGLRRTAGARVLVRERAWSISLEEKDKKSLE